MALIVTLTIISSALFVSNAQNGLQTSLIQTFLPQQTTVPFSASYSPATSGHLTGATSEGLDRLVTTDIPILPSTPVESIRFIEHSSNEISDSFSRSATSHKEFSSPATTSSVSPTSSLRSVSEESVGALSNSVITILPSSLRNSINSLPLQSTQTFLSTGSVISTVATSTTTVESRFPSVDTVTSVTSTAAESNSEISAQINSTLSIQLLRSTTSVISLESTPFSLLSTQSKDLTPSEDSMMQSSNTIAASTMGSTHTTHKVQSTVTSSLQNLTESYPAVATTRTVTQELNPSTPIFMSTSYSMTQPSVKILENSSPAIAISSHQSLAATPMPENKVELCVGGSSWCNHHGTCYNTTQFQIICSCTDGYYGTRCEFRSEDSDDEDMYRLAMYVLVGFSALLLLIFAIMLIYICRLRRKSENSDTINLQLDSFQQSAGLRATKLTEKQSLDSSLPERDYDTNIFFVSNGHAPSSDFSMWMNGLNPAKGTHKTFDSVAAREGRRKSLDSLDFTAHVSPKNSDVTDATTFSPIEVPSDHHQRPRSSDPSPKHPRSSNPSPKNPRSTNTSPNNPRSSNTSPRFGVPGRPHKRPSSAIDLRQPDHQRTSSNTSQQSNISGHHGPPSSTGSGELWHHGYHGYAAREQRFSSDFDNYSQTGPRGPRRSNEHMTRPTDRNNHKRARSMENLVSTRHDNNDSRVQPWEVTRPSPGQSPNRGRQPRKKGIWARTQTEGY